jgi:hypothetical protein
MRSRYRFWLIFQYVFKWGDILNAQRAFEHCLLNLPEVLDLGSRALRKRLNKSSISSIFSGGFDGASDSLDNAETLEHLDNPPPSKDTHSEKLGNNDKYIMNVIATNNHRVADVFIYFDLTFLVYLDGSKLRYVQVV